MSEQQYIKDQLIEVAHQTFVRYGFKKTTLDDIAQKFGKGKTAIYYYFNSRDEIYRAVLDKEVTEALDMLRQATDKVTGDVEKIEAYVEVRLKLSGHTPLLNEAEHEVRLQNNEWVDSVQKRFSSQKVEVLSQILAHGIRQGVFKIEEPELAALAIETALKGLERDRLPSGESALRSEKLLKLLFYGLLQ
ncbi:TetR family transcriptional regulator [Breznakibacter xylanolyticus]|uniref:TetR family transcriptional regulator n=1 Tax=Breznakibacter xylanolyticus TaxID=990 RepID=A0A2W7NK46_9BACT|nr:TetR/AcrR family transcriptional regulator [Breznakibacter xylanolyticus]PZX20648.1 TetR family transcriptional regulator [Breznakibacter xylanolyticus]